MWWGVGPEPIEHADLKTKEKLVHSNYHHMSKLLAVAGNITQLVLQSRIDSYNTVAALEQEEVQRKAFRNAVCTSKDKAVYLSFFSLQ